MKIEIEMLDAYRGLGAGRRIVQYLGFKGDRLLCEDLLGNRVRVPRNLFRFLGVYGTETRTGKNGDIEICVDGEWRSVGQLFP